MTKKSVHNNYSTNEERWHVASHALGVLLALVFMPLLIYKTAQLGQAKLTWAMVGFAFFTLVQYAVSSIYHASKNKKQKFILRKLDHLSIYLLIAASYTPFMLYYFWDKRGPELTVVLWILAIMGVVFKLFYAHRFKWVSTLVYIAMGWLAIFLGKAFFTETPRPVLYLIIAEGLCFTLGTIFYLNKKMEYSHAIWHFMVLAGSIFHYLALYVAISLH